MQKEVLLRGGLWVGIAAIAWFMEKTDALDAAKLAAMTWMDWARLVLGMVLTGFITLRTFLDQTLARYSGLPEDKKVSDVKA